MDYSEASKKHSRRVIISEIIMTVTVVITVILLVLISSGYWLNTDLKVERQGMLQIHSQPTGATVEVDGSDWSWLDRTNSSKVLSAGEHKIALKKDGYDSWSRTINISEGLLYRIHYPRLFLLERAPEKVYNAEDYTSASVSPDGHYMLLLNNTTKWLLLNLESDKLDPKELDISSLFASVSIAGGASTGLFTGTIEGLDWTADSSHILIKTDSEWAILNPRDPKNSVNLTKKFAETFSRLEFLDNSGNNLLALKSGSLYKLDVASGQISSVLVKDVASFDHFNNEIFFSAKTQDTEQSAVQSSEKSAHEGSEKPDSTSENEPKKPYFLGLLTLGDSKIIELSGEDAPSEVAISKFYDAKYLTILENNVITLRKYEDFTEVLTQELSFTPKTALVGHDGEFIEFIADKNFATLDMEALKVSEWMIDSSHFGWLDPDMLYSVNDGKLRVYDFDGENRRTLAENASDHFPVAISADKWLYYFSDGALLRELVK